METVTGVYVRERFRFPKDDGGEHVIGVLRTDKGEVVIKGDRVGEHPKLHCQYSISGQMRKYENRRTGQVEDQLNFNSICEAMPVSRIGVLELLKACGMKIETAKKAWAENGPETIEKILSGEAKGVKPSAKVLSELGKFARNSKDRAEAVIQLHSMLEGLRTPKKLPQALVDRYGGQAAAIVAENPFKMMSEHRVGFRLCDRLWAKLGLPMDHPTRQLAAVTYVFDLYCRSSTYMLRSNLETLHGHFVGSGARSSEFINQLIADGVMVQVSTLANGDVYFDGPIHYVGMGAEAEAEARIARQVRRLLERVPEWPAVHSESLSDHQREQLRVALSGQLGILCGGPGTGKTFTAARVITACVAKYGVENVAVLSFTGKACQRANQSLIESGIDTVRAITIHSFLRWDHASKRWHHNAENPRDVRVVVVDEPSMVDTNIMAALLDALPEYCHVLMVGDDGQLPPVGSGAPLRDMLAYQVPTGKLTETRRNSGMIVEACTRVRDGRMFDMASHMDIAKGINLQHVPADPEKPASYIKAFKEVGDFIEGLGYNRWSDMQVLLARNANGPVNRVWANRELQRICTGEPKDGLAFNTGDRVLCKRNHQPLNYLEDDWGVKEPCYVANGDIGVAGEIDEKTKRVMILLECPKRLVGIFNSRADETDDEEVAEWQLGYAITCHSSQGSEYPFVAVFVDPGATTSREWWLTAISRAKVGCFIIGPSKPIVRGVVSSCLKERKTFLTERLCRTI